VFTSRATSIWRWQGGSGSALIVPVPYSNCTESYLFDSFITVPAGGACRLIAALEISVNKP
jgi:hypothetical protein